MNKKVEDIVKLIRTEDIRMIDFKMIDINGQFRHVTIPAKDFGEEIMQRGVGFDASNYGYAVVEKSDGRCTPLPAGDWPHWTYWSPGNPRT